MTWLAKKEHVAQDDARLAGAVELGCRDEVLPRRRGSAPDDPGQVRPAYQGEDDRYPEVDPQGLQSGGSAAESPSHNGRVGMDMSTSIRRCITVSVAPA